MILQIGEMPGGSPPICCTPPALAEWLHKLEGWHGGAPQFTTRHQAFDVKYDQTRNIIISPLEHTILLGVLQVSIQVHTRRTPDTNGS